MAGVTLDHRRPGMRVRRWMRRTVIAASALALACGGLVASWLAGVHLPLVSGRTYVEITKLDRAGYSGQADGAVFIALIGSDYRPGVGGERGDAIHVLALNPDLGQGTILNFPRDTCVPVPGRGTTRINTAHSEGGPRLTGEVLASVTGAPIEYAVSVDFAGFIGIVDGVGGVEMNNPIPMSDGAYSGANFPTGPLHLNGGEALAYARDRHDFGVGDIQRTWNQGFLITSALRELRRDFESPSARFRLLALLARHAKISGAGLSDLYRLGQAAYEVRPSDIKNLSVPTTGGGCLTLGSEALGVFADFADDGVLQTHAGGAPDNPTGR
jgi:LCP family protein required for cell wall assembly